MHRRLALLIFSPKSPSLVGTISRPTGHSIKRPPNLGVIMKTRSVQRPRAKLSSTYDGHALRWLLMAILAATAVTLLGAPRAVTGVVAIVGVAIVIALIVRERRADRGSASAVSRTSKNTSADTSKDASESSDDVR